MRLGRLGKAALAGIASATMAHGPAEATVPQDLNLTCDVLQLAQGHMRYKIMDCANNRYEERDGLVDYVIIEGETPHGAKLQKVLYAKQANGTKEGAKMLAGKSSAYEEVSLQRLEVFQGIFDQLKELQLIESELLKNQ